MGASSARPVRPGSRNPRTRPAEDKTKFDKWLIDRMESNQDVAIEFMNGDSVIVRIKDVDRYMIRVSVMYGTEEQPLRWFAKSAIFSCE